MWTYNNVEVTEIADDIVGFVYLITNLTNGRMYIGKKLAKFSKTTVKTVKLKNQWKKRTLNFQFFHQKKKKGEVKGRQ